MYEENSYNNYQEMADSATDWSHLCHYQLSKTSAQGINKIFNFPNMQLAYTDDVGSVMYNFKAPKDRICISILKEVEEKACLNNIKLKTGQIVIFDDSKTHNFLTSSKIVIFDITIKKSFHPLLYSILKRYIDKSIIDTQNHLSNLLSDIFTEYSTYEDIDKKTRLSIKEKIIQVILDLANNQEPTVPKLTKGEEITFRIREKYFNHMDANISIESLSKEFAVSGKTLQNAFKSLFGFTPKKFLRLLKLNMIHHNLSQMSTKEITVTEISRKWGFNHMGRMSHYYKELFNEKPIETLNHKNSYEQNDITACVIRQEEIL